MLFRYGKGIKPFYAKMYRNQISVENMKLEQEYFSFQDPNFNRSKERTNYQNAVSSLRSLVSG